MNSTRLQFLEMAFDSEELGPPGLPSPSASLLQTLKQNSRTYDECDKYYSPYTTLVIQSGGGKSFAVKHLAATQGVYVVYCNLGPAGRPSIPPCSSPTKARMLQQATLGQAETFWRRYMTVGVEMVFAAEEQGISPADLFRLQSHSSFQAQQEELARLLDDKYWTAKSSGGDADEEAAATLPLDACRHDKIHSILDTAGLRTAPGSLDNSNLLCVICLDDCASLLGDSDKYSEDDSAAWFHYQAVCHALRETRSRGLRVFGLLVDASPRISNVAPLLNNDHGAESAEASGPSDLVH